MISLNIFWLVIMVILAVFIPNWTIPVVLVFVNRLLITWISPLILLIICIIAWWLWNVMLWFFDDQVHVWFKKHFWHKKKQHKKKNGYFTKLTNKVLKRVERIRNPILLFFTIIFCSFSIVPDIMTLEIVRKKVKPYMFILAISTWKVVVYSPIIWWSVWVMEMIKASA